MDFSEIQPVSAHFLRCFGMTAGAAAQRALT
jgi:hypothetical protein